MPETITIIGTGGIIEGNLGTSNINVNLDAPYTFDGVDDFFYVADHNDFDLSATLTMSAWIKPTGSGDTWQMIMTKNGVDGDNDRAYALWYKNSGQIYMHLGDDSASTNMNTSGGTIADGAWHHVAATFDNSSNTGKIYINGVLSATSASLTTSPYNTGKRFTIGAISDNDGSPAAEFQGEIADAKLFSDVLTDAEVQEISQKINYDISAGSIGNLVGWWKLTEGNGNDSKTGGTAHNLTPSGSPAQDYDAFSVNVQDNTTTTDGAVTVTQGKLEGLSLSSVEFIGNGTTSGGTHDSIVTTNTGSLSMVESTISCWIRPDAVTGSGSGEQVILSSVYYDNNDFHLGQRNISKRFIFSVGDGDSLQFDLDITADRWHHLILSYTAGGGTDWLSAINIYLDGVEIPTANYISPTGSGTCETLTTQSVLYIGGKSGTGYFDGNIRDMRIYDYALSADQAASLYSGSYNVTPLHWWKIDEGTGATATIADSGTGTSGDGTGAGLDWDNGTLDLDGTLTIAANGTLSAPRGNLKYGPNTAMVVSNANGIVHNNGTLYFDRSGGTTLSVESGIAQTWYNWHIEGSTSTNLNWTSGYGNAITLEGTLTIESGALLQIQSASLDRTLVMGTSSAAGTIANSGTLDLDCNGAGHISISGASTLNPAVCTGTDWDWDDGSAGAGKIKLSNIDYQIAMATGGGACEIQLDGDCEFDAVTVTANDTLDLNGKRAVFGGDFTMEGVIDTDDSMIVFNTSGRPTGTPSSFTANANTKWLLNMNGTHTFDIDESLGTIFANQTGNWWLGNRIGGSLPNDDTNIIFGGGYHLNQMDHFFTNVTIATGGELNGDDQTINCSGDFTTSGGLIGKSAMEFNGSSTTCKVTDHGDFDGLTNLTIMGWYKVDTVAQSSSLMGQNTSFLLSAIHNTADNIMFEVYDSAGAAWVSAGGATTQTVDNKWHHVAGVVDAANNKIYVYLDGKLDGEADWGDSRSINGSGYDINIGGYNSSNYMDGHIAVASIWNVALSASQIRAKMFSDFAGLDSNTGCKGWWQFDEGTGASVASEVGAHPAALVNHTVSNSGWAVAGDFDGSDSSCILKMTGSSKNINYTGDETIGHLHIDDGQTTLNEITASGTDTFTCSSILIDSGTTFTSTAGTFKLANGNTDTGYIFRNSGTFNHNFGKVLVDFTPAQNWYMQCNEYYDLEVKYNNNTYLCYMTDQADNAIAVLGDLTLTNGLFGVYTASDTFTVHGNTFINGAVFENAADQTGQITHHGLVTLNSGTYKLNSGQTVKVGGFRKVGGTLTIA